MIIQTPRLCNDVAFLPPQKDHPNSISCSPILSEAEIPAYESDLAAASAAAASVDSQTQNPFEKQEHSKARPTIGGIEVGARKYVPQGKEIEKSAIVGGGKETYVETIADSMGKLLSAEEMKKMGLGDPQTVQRLKKRLDEMAGDSGWKLEVYDTPRGREYRGVIGDDEDESTGKEDKTGDVSNGDEQEEKGSEETYKEKDEL